MFQDLMEQLEKQDRTIRKLKKQLKVYSKRIGEMGGTGIQQSLRNRLMKHIRLI